MTQQPAPAPGAITTAKLQRLLDRLPSRPRPIAPPQVPVETMPELAEAMTGEDWFDRAWAAAEERRRHGAKLGGMFLDKAQRKRVQQKLNEERWRHSIHRGG